VEDDPSAAYRVPGVDQLGNGLKIRVALNDMIGRRIYDEDTTTAGDGAARRKTASEGHGGLDVRRPRRPVHPHREQAGRGARPGSQLSSRSGDFRLAAHECPGEPPGQRHRYSDRRSRTSRARSAFLSKCGTSAPIPSPSRETTRRSGRGASCLATTLDTYASAKGLSKIDFIKADVEGAELACCAGARHLGAADRPVLLLEFEEERQRAFGSSAPSSAGNLRSYGYSLWRIEDRLEPSPREPGDPSSLTCSRCTRRGRP